MTWARLALTLMAASIALAACTADTSASGPGWLVPIHQNVANNSDNVGKYCDVETGNLIYLYGDYRGGIAVVPGGCQKTGGNQ